MKLDRNTLIGFLIMGVLLIGYIYSNNREQASYRKDQARIDSIAAANRPKPDPVVAAKDSARADSANQIASAGSFQDALKGSEQLVYAENNLFKIAFTNKGGQPKWVELKRFKNMDSGHVKLASTDFDKISYRINTGLNNNSSTETGNLYFQPASIVTGADSSITVQFILGSNDSANTPGTIVHKYVIRKDDYMIDFNVQMNGSDKLLQQGIMNLTWQYTALQQESDISFEKQNTQIGYKEDNEFDYHTIGRTSSVNFTKPVQWIGVRQRFFNTYLVAKNNFTSGSMDWTIPADEKKMLVQTTTNMKLPVVGGNAEFKIFYGPADYHTLRKQGQDFDKLVNLGQGIYAFVRPINRFIILPVWDFIKSFVGSFGLVIALLTLFIRLIISPLSYKSYLSGAKMKVLRPEIATLKEKHGGDQQAMSMEQMKLFREAGVNPLGGCIPALLQIPIFFALYSFFNSSVDLRGTDFLWANDLSAFDEVIKFGVNVPLLGSHLSLFTITAVVTSFLISLYSMSMSPDQSNPVMKYMPYIFPIFLLFIFNKLPSALTWYYTVSNLITLALQFVIQNYIIDHDKILAKIQENRKKPKTKSKWQERMEQMQDQQKKMKELQQKNRN